MGSTLRLNRAGTIKQSWGASSWHVIRSYTQESAMGVCHLSLCLRLEEFSSGRRLCPDQGIITTCSHWGFSASSTPTPKPLRPLPLDGSSQTGLCSADNYLHAPGTKEKARQQQILLPSEDLSSLSHGGIPDRES